MQYVTIRFVSILALSCIGTAALAADTSPKTKSALVPAGATIYAMPGADCAKVKVLNTMAIGMQGEIVKSYDCGAKHYVMVHSPAKGNIVESIYLFDESEIVER